MEVSGPGPEDLNITLSFYSTLESGVRTATQRSAKRTHRASCGTPPFINEKCGMGLCDLFLDDWVNRSYQFLR